MTLVHCAKEQVVRRRWPFESNATNWTTKPHSILTCAALLHKMQPIAQLASTETRTACDRSNNCSQT